MQRLWSAFRGKFQAELWIDLSSLTPRRLLISLILSPSSSSTFHCRSMASLMAPFPPKEIGIHIYVSTVETIPPFPLSNSVFPGREVKDWGLCVGGGIWRKQLQTKKDSVITAWEVCLQHCFWNTHTHSLLSKNTVPSQVFPVQEYSEILSLQYELKHTQIYRGNPP